MYDIPLHKRSTIIAFITKSYSIVQVKITILIIIDFYKNKEKFANVIQESDKINIAFLCSKCEKKNFPDTKTILTILEFSK